MTVPNGDLNPEDRARTEAGAANLAGIVAGRLRAASTLLAPPGPKRALDAAWAPILHRGNARRATPPRED